MWAPFRGPSFHFKVVFGCPAVAAWFPEPVFGTVAVECAVKWFNWWRTCGQVGVG